MEEKSKGTDRLKTLLSKEGVSPEDANPVLERFNSAPIKHQVKLSSLITRPGITMDEIREMNNGHQNDLAEALKEESPEVIEQAEIQMKYDGYISREQDVADKMSRLEGVKIPTDIDFSKLSSLSTEAKMKLQNIQPATIGQASRISGVSPSDVSVLLVYLGR
jgi:tRNA uridine 5-carboxymethylaminomethyl modification enzyme